MSTSAPRVAAWGFFGIGNLGNEASLAAFLSFMRREHPDVAMSCLAARPETVRREHGIPARQLMAFRADSRAGFVATVLKGVSRLWDIPRTWRMVGDIDVLVVPGTGVLESGLMTSPWGLPYWLFVVTLACRLRGRRVLILSVGAEYALHPVTRRLNRLTVRLADVCSYRDAESREAIRDSGVDAPLGDVVPDLAFALPTPEGRSLREGHVVIGVIAYDGDHPDPSRVALVRRTYLERMTELVTRLIDGGRTVTLVIGDLHDEPVAVELARLVSSARPESARRLLTVSDGRTFAAVMAVMADAEVVVASRFHNVIAALKESRPTISLGYADKNEHLLAEFGLGQFDQPVDDFDVDRVIGQLVEVQSGQSGRETLVKETLARFDHQLDEQFRLVSTELLDSGRRRR